MCIIEHFLNIKTEHKEEKERERERRRQGERKVSWCKGIWRYPAQTDHINKIKMII